MSALNIPITKAGKGVTIEVDTDALPESMYKRAMEEGLKVLLNSRMSKVTIAKKEGKELEDSHASAMLIAEENLKRLLAGTLEKRGASTAKEAGVDRYVMSEARRLAKELVKNEIRRAGHKPSMVEAKDITAAANALLESDPSFIEQAKLNLAERSKVQAQLDISALVQESPRLKAKAAEKKATSKAILSKTQAGKVAPRKARDQHVH